MNSSSDSVSSPHASSAQHYNPDADISAPESPSGEPSETAVFATELLSIAEEASGDLDEATPLPELVKKHIKVVLEHFCATANPNRVDGKSYLAQSYNKTKKWSSLQPYQMKIVRDLWFNVSEEVRVAIKNKFPSEISVSAPSVSSNTTPNCKARLIHMLSDPAIASKFEAAYATWDRKTLDDKTHRDDAKKSIADIYNDPLTYEYKNPTVANTYPSPSAAPGYNFGFKICGHIRPDLAVTYYGEPSLIDSDARDFVWLFDKLNSLRSEYMKVKTKYGKSGDQFAEDPVETFWKFCNGQILILYAFIVWGQQSQLIENLLSKVVDADIAMDSCLLGQDTPSSASKRTSASVKKKREPSSAPGSESTKRIILDVQLPSETGNLAREKHEWDLNMSIVSNSALAGTDLFDKARKNLERILEGATDNANR